MENDDKIKSLANIYYIKVLIYELKSDYENAELYYKKAILLSSGTDKYTNEYDKMVNNNKRVCQIIDILNEQYKK